MSNKLADSCQQSVMQNTKEGYTKGMFERGKEVFRNNT